MQPKIPYYLTTVIFGYIDDYWWYRHDHQNVIMVPRKVKIWTANPHKELFSILMLVYGLILAQNAVEKSLRIFRRPERSRIPVIFLGNGWRVF